MGGLTDGARGPEVTSGDRLALLWRRVKEHRIAQWTVGYVALAYAIQHAVILTSESFEWPNIVARFSMLLLALGLPLAMTLAWYHGDSANRRISGGELAIVSTLLVIGAFLFYTFAQPSEKMASLTKPPPPQAGEMSIAVLPFDNLSRDPEQEFFPDGMTDEIMTALSKVQALRVVGRESAYQYKNQKTDNRTMGQALGARYLIEGSVRKAGDRVRITAQLVQADNGVGLWTEAYDRELKDIFAVQENIAQAIVAALRIPLGLKQGQTLVTNPGVDTDSYQNYLRAKSLVRARGDKRLNDAVTLLEQVVARDPNYAPGWGLLALAHTLRPTYDPDRGGASLEELRRNLGESHLKAEQAAHRAIQLDTNNTEGRIALALMEGGRGNALESEDLLKQVLAIDPNNPDGLHFYSDLLGEVGRLKEALAMRQTLQMLEPFVPVFKSNTADILWLNGQNQAALAMLQEVPPDIRINLPRFYASMGDFNAAADALLARAPANARPGVREEAARLLRAHRPVAVSAMPAFDFNGGISFIYLYLGAPERALALSERNLEAGMLSSLTSSFYWHPMYAAARKTERFKNFVRKAGLVAYWKARGWPDLCHPVGADDFACH